MLGRPLGRRHWRGDGPQPPHPKGQSRQSMCHVLKFENFPFQPEPPAEPEKVEEEKKEEPAEEKKEEEAKPEKEAEEKKEEAKPEKEEKKEEKEKVNMLTKLGQAFSKLKPTPAAPAASAAPESEAKAEAETESKEEDKKEVCW